MAALATMAERAVQLEAGPAAFTRGAAAAEAGSVRGLRFNGRTLSARVRGTHRYRVSVAFGDDVAYHCECPVGEEGACCAHCVATVLCWIDGLVG